LHFGLLTWFLGRPLPNTSSVCLLTVRCTSRGTFALILGLQPCTLHVQEVVLLAQQRGAGMPPIRVVADLPQSDQWAAVHVDLPFEAVNGALGVQLERSIMRGVPT
jgi:hypothetical protein